MVHSWTKEVADFWLYVCKTRQMYMPCITRDYWGGVNEDVYEISQNMELTLNQYQR
jgi:hypothetical protein